MRLMCVLAHSDKDQIHLAQYSVDRDDLERALDTYEDWAKRVLEVGVPETWMGYPHRDSFCVGASSTTKRAVNALPASSGKAHVPRWLRCRDTPWATM